MIDLDNLDNKIERNVNEYWPNFQIVAYALYNKTSVYLYNHPNFLSKNKPYYTMGWNEQFNGADTLILYQGYPTAIVNLDLYEEMESVYPIVIHELFHGYQYLQEEKRFPNEMLGMIYPLSEENVELRTRERKALYHAVFTSDAEDKRIHLKEFIRLREKRQLLMNEFIDYESAIETVEGPASYVEWQALSHIRSHTNLRNPELYQYGDNLIDPLESAIHLRKSCYTSGLFICLLLDKIYPNWKDVFFTTDQLLYGLLKKSVDLADSSQLKTVEISKETISIINKMKGEKQEYFKQFKLQKGYHLYITGDMISKAYDPMNIIAMGDKLLHKNFVTIQLGDTEYYFNHLLLATIR